MDCAGGDDDVIVSAALLHVFYRNGSLNVSGFVLDKRRTSLSRLSGHPVTYNPHDRNLTFSYTVHSTKNEEIVTQGYEELQLQGDDKNFDCYNGFVFKKTERAVVTVEGQKVDQNDLGKMSSRTEREQYLRDFLENSCRCQSQ